MATVIHRPGGARRARPPGFSSRSKTRTSRPRRSSGAPLKTGSVKLPDLGLGTAYLKVRIDTGPCPSGDSSHRGSALGVWLGLPPSCRAIRPDLAGLVRPRRPAPLTLPLELLRPIRSGEVRAEPINHVAGGRWNAPHTATSFDQSAPLGIGQEGPCDLIAGRKPRTFRAEFPDDASDHREEIVFRPASTHGDAYSVRAGVSC
jgi:hypothetical protein